MMQRLSSVSTSTCSRPSVPGCFSSSAVTSACTRRGVTNGTLSSERRRAGFVDNTPLKWLPRCRCVEVNSGTWRCAIVSSQGNSTRQLLVGLAHCHHRPFVPVPFLATPKPISIRSAFGPDEGPSFSCGYSESSLRIFFDNSRPNLGRRWVHSRSDLNSLLSRSLAPSSCCLFRVRAKRVEMYGLLVWDTCPFF